MQTDSPPKRPVGLALVGRRRISLALIAALVAIPSTAQAAWPTLNDVLGRARDHAPASVEARGAEASARATGVGARASSWGNPYLEVVADRGRITNDVQVLGQLFLPVDIHGQRSARIDEADRLASWRQHSRSEVVARTQGETASTYGEVMVAAALVQEATEQEAEARRESAWFAARAQAGDATKVEKGLADAEIARYLQARTEATLRLVQARARLTMLTGLTEFDPIPAPGLPPSADARAKSLANNGSNLPAVKALDSEASYWAANRSRYDTEKNAPFYLLLYGGRGDLAETRYGGGFAYTFPVSRKNQGEVARAQAEQSRATQLRAPVQTALSARLKASIDTLQAIAQVLNEIDTSGVGAAKSVVEATQEAFKAGKVELVRVIIAKRDLATARARRLELIATAWRAYGDMLSIAGEGRE